MPVSGEPGRLFEEAGVRSIWAFPEVGAARAVGRGQRWLDERVLVGWAAPSLALAELARPGVVDRRRVLSMSDRERISFLSGRALLDQLLAELVPGTIAGSIDTDSSGGPGPVAVYGVPALATLSHAPALIAAAVAATSRVVRLGIDVESRSTPRSADPPATLGGESALSLTDWVAGQAVLKARRLGLRADPRLVSLTAGRARIQGYSASFRVEAVAADLGHELAVAWQPARS